MRLKQHPEPGLCHATKCHEVSTVIVATVAQRVELCDRHWAQRCDEQTNAAAAAQPETARAS